MNRPARRRGFALVELVAVVILVALLLMLGCSGASAALDASNRTSCINKAKQLSFACAWHQSSFKCFPFATDARAYKLGGPDRALAGTPSGSAAGGYSWIVSILPDIKEQKLYDQIRATSNDFVISPFDPANVLSGEGNPHIASPKLLSLRCPSTAANENAQASVFSTVAGGAAATNYVCIVGTNFLPNGGDIVPNGIIVPKTPLQQRAVRQMDVMDGISKTIILCESNEENYSSWLDGQCTWVTGMQETEVLGDFDKTDNPLPDAVNLKQRKDGYRAVTKDSLHALNWGPKGTRTVPYLRDNAPGATPRNWGPSSAHSGNVVVHAFADNHIVAIPDTIDATTYYRLITRHGGEPTENL